ncbi:MAG: hypothetical protein M3Z26_00350 [Bacteroidota bacterium]|nr:hypothetical protein [Bacteroidota bacterium]
MFKSFDVYSVYDFSGLLVNVYAVNDDDYVHYFVDLDIYFISELPF